MIQGDQKVSVHLMITGQKTGQTVSITYHDNVVKLGITDGVSESLVSPWPWRSCAKQSD
jgi:hypothetical protein